jgi:hypothetical protein
MQTENPVRDTSGREWLFSKHLSIKYNTATNIKAKNQLGKKEINNLKIKIFKDSAKPIN